MEKYTSPYSGERIDRSVAMIPEKNPEEESILVISKAGEGSYKKVSEVGATVVQETGKATDKVMSQDATTKELNKKLSTSNIGQGLSFSNDKINANIAKIQAADSTEFTPDENGVVTIPNGSRTNFGLFKSDFTNGIQSPNGVLSIWPANKEDINKRTNSFSGTLYPDGPMRPIVYNAINYVVKAALTDDKRIGTETTAPTTFTDTEKDRACEILGASRKLYRHYATFDTLSYGSCKLSFISLKPDVYSSADNLSELKDVVSVEYCTIGDSGYLMGAIYINPFDGDYVLMTAKGSLVISNLYVSSFTDTVTEL